jgi:hypothetical protein
VTERPRRILALSDIVDGAANGPGARERFGDVDLVIGCGDLPYDRRGGGTSTSTAGSSSRTG